MRQGEVVLETRGLSMHFGGVRAVDRVDFALYENELRCLIGPNGAGKSTFFKCLTGQLRATAGSVVIRDIHVTDREPFEVAALGVGIKTQVPNVFEGLAVEENVWLSARRWHPPARARSLTAETLERLRLGEIRSSPVGRLAHGQRQWVELGMVVAAEPWLVLLDEPAAGMTHEETVRTAELIREINRTATLIVVEHDMQFIRMISNLVTVFHEGRILMEDTMEAISPIRGPGRSTWDTGHESGVGAMSVLLEVKALSAGYGRVPVLHGVDFTVEEGEIVGVLGHNGMGKTTLLKTIMGIVPATGGVIGYAGLDLTRERASERARLGLGYVPQGRGIFPNLSVQDNIRMGIAAHGGDEEDAVRRILAGFPRLEPLLDREGGALSGGEQQLLAIARCLISEPELVLLDEPTEGIQPSIVDAIIELLRNLNREQGVTIVMVEQNLDFITELSDRVLLLQKGVITGEVKGADVANPALIEEFTGFGGGGGGAASRIAAPVPAAAASTAGAPAPARTTDRAPSTAPPPPASVRTRVAPARAAALQGSVRRCTGPVRSAGPGPQREDFLHDRSATDPRPAQGDRSRARHEHVRHPVSRSSST